MKAIKDYDVDEVCIWVGCIGKIADKVDGFRENAIDGPMLVALTEEDLKGDLGFSGLECRKFFTKLQFTQEMIASSNGGGSSNDDDASQRLEALEKENQALKAELSELQSIQAAMAAPPPAPAPAPRPAPAPAPPAQHRGPGVVGGAARGAAGGAMKGAIAGAILPGMSAADGAKAGAAVGATTGGLRGLRNRRRRF